MLTDSFQYTTNLDMISLSTAIFTSPTPSHPSTNPLNFAHRDRFAVSMSHIPTTATTTTTTTRRCNLYDLHKEIVPYAKAWSWQKQIVNQRKLLSENNDEDFADSLIVLQHNPVYTLGTGSSHEFLSFDIEDSPFDVYRTERGGEVTYHGPGQLVMYPIINLRYHKMDLHWYMRALEEVVIRALSTTFGIEASRVEGLTGVWVGDQKLAAIGVKVSRWVTYHGLALNVTTDMTPFQRIVPCGIRGRQVGSIKGLLKESYTYNDDGGEENRQFDDYDLIDITHNALIREFCEVFQVDLQCQPTDIYRNFS